MELLKKHRYFYEPEYFDKYFGLILNCVNFTIFIRFHSYMIGLSVMGTYHKKPVENKMLFPTGFLFIS